MNELQIKTLVDGAIALHREIATRTEQLKALKAELVHQARCHSAELDSTGSGGKRWTAAGTDGAIARVNFPAPALVPELDAQCEKAKQAQVLAGGNFRRLFTPVKIYLLGDDFRAQAKALLSAPNAEALLKLLETDSAPRVSFETAKRTVEEVA